ncbi:MAG: metalloregulator ArsR/SmtB family transcription factor, partial [Lachnospiraceae bacterium]|nr:metalloregulator ArsR/SmtB family transcription factor [Lachnospiraceae bacterium]
MELDYEGQSMKSKKQNKPEAEECCGYIHIHQEVIDKVDTMMPEEEKLADLAEFFRVFGDTTRIKILYVLLCCEMCVCDIAHILNISQSA